MDNKRFCILAWLPPNPVEKTVVVNDEERVYLFDDYKVAWDWAVDQLTPDFEFVVLPISISVIED